MNPYGKLLLSENCSATLRVDGKECDYRTIYWLGDSPPNPENPRYELHISGDNVRQTHFEDLPLGTHHASPRKQGGLLNADQFPFLFRRFDSLRDHLGSTDPAKILLVANTVSEMTVGENDILLSGEVRDSEEVLREYEKRMRSRWGRSWARVEKFWREQRDCSIVNRLPGFSVEFVRQEGSDKYYLQRPSIEPSHEILYRSDNKDAATILFDGAKVVPRHFFFLGETPLSFGNPRYEIRLQGVGLRSRVFPHHRLGLHQGILDDHSFKLIFDGQQGWDLFEKFKAFASEIEGDAPGDVDLQANTIDVLEVTEDEIVVRGEAQYLDQALEEYEKSLNTGWVQFCKWMNNEYPPNEESK